MANVQLNDPLVEKLLAVVQGQTQREVSRAMLAFRAIVDQYAESLSQEVFQVKISD
jgi:hypothetical protein